MNRDWKFLVPCSIFLYLRGPFTQRVMVTRLETGTGLWPIIKLTKE
jgi:hypothetical protein